MSTLLWITQGLLAAFVLVAGLGKLTQPRDRLIERMGWVEDVGYGTARSAGVAEVLAALGLILPGLTGVAVILTPLAATGIAVVQLGAITIHRRRGESQAIVLNTILIVLSAFIAWGRFGPYPLGEV